MSHQAWDTVFSSFSVCWVRRASGALLGRSGPVDAAIGESYQ
ncbi:hypothetical protein ACWDZ8_09865 [Streptomyces sp. NPDC003233]